MNFTSAILRAVNFSDVTNMRSKLGETKINIVNFNVANLVSANLRNANLNSAMLRGAILYNADLSGAILYYTTLEKANFSKSRTWFVKVDSKNAVPTNKAS